MKYAMPLVILAVMGLMLFISWSNVSSYRTEAKLKFDQYIAQGEKYEEKGILIDAVKQYESAQKMNAEDYALAMHIVGLRDQLDDDTEYINACKKAIKSDKTQAEPYLLAAERYLKTGSEQDAYKILKQADTNLADSANVTDEQRKQLSDMVVKVMSRFRTIAFTGDEFYGFHQTGGKGKGAAKIRKGDLYGVLSSSGSRVLEVEYEDISLPANDLIPICSNGEYFYITSKGYRKIVPDGKAETLGIFSDKYAPLKIDGTYGYINQKMENKHFEYEFAGSFENGVAAVKKDGKWGLINTQFEAKVPVQFDEIKLDYYGFCATYGVFFARTGSTWGLYDLTGAELASGFEDVRQFASEQPAAVKQGGKWGFITKKGEMCIDPQYDDADSFSDCYAPVKINGKWGCIEEKNRVVIEPQFDLLTAFSDSGYAYCEVDGFKKFVIVKNYT